MLDDAITTRLLCTVLVLILVLGRDGTSRSSLLADRAKRMVRDFPMPESAISPSRIAGGHVARGWVSGLD